MTAQICFFLSISFALVAWGLVSARSVWPKLKDRPRDEALQPILMLHSFRFIGLSFLVPGVVAQDLPPAFAHAAAYGDIVAAALALLTLSTNKRGSLRLTFAWIFNLWGSVDILNAFFQAGRSGLVPGAFGAAYFLPTLIVPLLLVTHILAFRILLRNQSEAMTLNLAHPA